MRYVERDRIEAPSIYSSEKARAERQNLVALFSGDELKRQQTRADRSFSAIDHPEIRSSLSTLFGHRCAFCESPTRKPLVHRFRPTEGAHPITDKKWSHLYYSWLMSAWQNLYPICAECRPEDPFYFPVAGNRRSPVPDLDQIEEYANRTDGRWPFFPLNENPILIDPCYDRKLWRHFHYSSDGIVAPYNNDRRGRETIAYFRLDRPELCAARSDALNNHFNQLFEAMGKGSLDKRLTETTGPFQGAWFLYLRRLLGRALNRKPYENVERYARMLREKDDWEIRLKRSREELLAARSRTLSRSVETEYRSGSVLVPKSISIQNFKSLEKLEISLSADPSDSTDGAGAMLILGENAVGKSTILEALAITLMASRSRGLLDLKSGQLVLNPKYLGGDNVPSPSSAMITLEYSSSKSQTLRIKPSSDASGTSHVANDFRDSGTVNAIPLFAYGAYRQYLGGERKHSPHKYIRTLFEPNQPLSNPEKWLMGLGEHDFNTAVRALREVFSVEGNFEVLERGPDGVFVQQRLGTLDTSPIQRTPIGVVSSGFRAVLAMVCDIINGLMDSRISPAYSSLESARALVLIDEIEAHLHPRWKMAIISGLRKALPQVTFIATSHDPLCLRGMCSNEVMVLERILKDDQESTLPVYTQALVDLPDNEHWTIEQLLTADFFQLRSTASIEVDRRFARMQDRLAQGVRPDDDSELRAFLSEFSDTLPIGNTEVHRLVQDAIASFLAEQRTATDKQLKKLKNTTRQSIINALKSAT